MNASYRWRVVGASVPGAAHKRAGKPNQDSLQWSQQSGTGLPLVLSVSDGHGSAVCFRSEVGSRLAVDVAIRTLLDTAAHLDDSVGTRASVLNRYAQDQLPKLLIRNWNESVDRHINAHPCSRGDIRRLLRVAGRPSVEKLLRENQRLAYGATLLSAMVMDDCILYVQLGDGDIVVVSEDGEPRRAIPKDSRLIGNETASLCEPNAWRDVRATVQSIEDQPPALILVSTDGYANSFVNDDGFLQVGSDLLKIVREHGLDYVDKELNNWLDEASCAGSGDDVTVGVICRL